MNIFCPKQHFSINICYYIFRLKEESVGTRSETFDTKKCEEISSGSEKIGLPCKG